MPVRVFKEEERAEIRKKMLEAGFPLLKEYGMTHMSITKIAERAGIGKSTFYNFFPSKEAYVMAMIQYRREELPAKISQILHGRQKMTREEGEVLAKQIIFSENSVYAYLNMEDEEKLMKAFPESAKANLVREKHIMDEIFQYIEGVRLNPDYEVIGNLMKSIVLIYEGREVLHEAGLERTINAMFELMFSYIFEER